LDLYFETLFGEINLEKRGATEGRPSFFFHFTQK